MFFLKDLPTDMSLQEFSRRYPNMNPSALRTCAGLMRTGSDLLAAFETVSGQYGLSQGRLLVLIVMNRRPLEALNPSFLAEKLSVTRATITGLLDGLENENLIERVSDTRDRRRIGVRLTPEGKQVLEELLPDYYQTMARLTAGLSENERQTMLALLSKINRKLNSQFD